MGRQSFVACVGEALVDFVASETSVNVGQAKTFTRTSGGAVANTATALARLGVPTRFIGKVGKDHFGIAMKKEMETEGIDVSFVSVSKKYPTGLVFVSLDEDRVPAYCFFGDPSADMMLSKDEISSPMLDDCSFFHLGTVSMVHEVSREATYKLIDIAKDKDVKISFDPNTRLHLWKDHDLLKKTALRVIDSADLVKLNEQELEFITGENDPIKGARKLLPMGPKTVVVTKGPDGAYYAGPEEEGYVPGLQVDVTDTTGAGDGFSAGLLSVLNENPWPPRQNVLKEAVTLANCVGAIVTTAIGARTALPDRETVNSLVRD
jgi:fructokinase